MAYLGNTPTTQAFTPAIDYFSGTGSATAFTLSRPVASVAQVQVVIDNVAQNPSSAYTISGSTITFTSAPLSGTNNIYVYYTSPITQVIAPGQGTVNTTALGNITNIASGNSSLTLQTGSGNTTAVTVDTSQNVTLNSTTAQLTVTGNGSTSGLIVASNVASRPSTSNPMLQITSGAGSGIYGYAGNAVLSGRPTDTNGYGNIYIQTGSTQQNQWTFSNGANLILPGGSTSATGTGITFPATQSASSDANTLDDYEEGTFTPTLTDGTNNVSTYSQRTGNYVKVGNIITVVIEITVSNKGSVSSSLRITGLPFTTSKNGFQGAGLAQTSWSSLSGTLTGGMYGGDIYLYNQAAGSQTNINGGSNLTNTSQMGISITYTL